MYQFSRRSDVFYKKKYFQDVLFSIMPKQYKCLQCDKTFKRKNYHLKHVRNQHQFFQCEICKQKVKEGSRTVHILRCKRREQMKTTRCLLCNKNFAFDSILYHLKHTHNVWEHIKMSTKPATRSLRPLIYEDKGLQVENGTITPPPTPEQQVPEEIEKIVQELRNRLQRIFKNRGPKIQEQRSSLWTKLAAKI